MTVGVKDLEKIIQQMETVIIGKRDVIERVLITLLCQGHVLIEDVPGVGKTSLVAALTKVIGGEFSRIQFTPDLLPSDITGFTVYNPKTGEFEYKKGVILTQFVLADEINRTSPKTQASLLEAMEEGQVTVEGTTYLLPKPFMVLATQNPNSYVGTFQLPEAQLDRFFMRLSMGYPDREAEVKMLQRFKKVNPLDTLKPVVHSEEILLMQEAVKAIYVEESIGQLVVDIVSQTRTHGDVILGASPRGSLALARGAQGLAYYRGRDYVLPEDVVKMAPLILAHRLQLRHEAQLRKVTAEGIIEQIIRQTKLAKVKYYEKQ